VIARRFRPDAITLDIRLPDMDGWRLLDALKRSPETRHIPVSVMSVEDRSEFASNTGAFSILTKPVERSSLVEAFAETEEFLSRRVKQLLVVEDDESPASPHHRDHRQ